MNFAFEFAFADIESETDIPYLRVLEELTHQYLLTERQIDKLVHYMEYSCVLREIRDAVSVIHGLAQKLKENEHKSKAWKIHSEITKYKKEQQLLISLQNLLANDGFFIHSFV